LLEDLCDSGVGDRNCALCRELTKRYEEVIRGTVTDVAAQIADRDLRGEIVLLLDRPAAVAVDGDGLDLALRGALAVTSLREAVAQVVAETGLPRRQVYQRALGLARKDGE
jgi:16S rRNA (cytidine1402-2'-O)-methyltransferase